MNTEETYNNQIAFLHNAFLECSCNLLIFQCVKMNNATKTTYETVWRMRPTRRTFAPRSALPSFD